MLEKLKFLYRGFKAQHRDQRLEIAALTRGVNPSSCIIDVGANKGSYLPALSRTVPTGQVLAFEPQPLLAAYLQHMTQACGMRNVAVFNLACSDQAGVLPLHIPGDAATSPGATLETTLFSDDQARKVEVQVVALDAHLADVAHIAAVKVDVEGHEIAVIRGMKQLIAKHRPVLVCEIEQRHLSHARIEDVLSEILALGYRGQFIRHKQLVPIEEFDKKVHQKTLGERFWDDAGYCNNFIFTPIQ